MVTQELHLELLLGKRVHDPSGRSIGRIEEIRAEQQGDECVVTEYLIGPTGLTRRLSLQRIGPNLLRLFGAHYDKNSYRIPWDKLDLSNPQQPRLRCTLDALSHQVDEHS